MTVVRSFNSSRQMQVSPREYAPRDRPHANGTIDREPSSTQRPVQAGECVCRGIVMPGDPEECRRHAAYCAELAQSARTPELKKTLIGLSKNWIKLATEMERSTALFDADGRVGNRATGWSKDDGGAKQPERNR
jgi:hypothetical protein